MNQATRNIVRPQWIQLLRMDGPADFDTVARRMFGKGPNGYHTAARFNKRLGIDITAHRGWFAEIGGAPSITGPVTPREVQPILAIRMSRRGNFRPIRMSLPGLFNEKLKTAWVLVDDYEKALDDRFFHDVIKDDDDNA